jgi:cell division protein FtsQ
MSIFDDLGPLERRVVRMEGVLEAKVSRRLPGTLRVRVREREAVALTERRGRLVLMDVNGTVLPFDPTTPADDLPLADADSSVGHLLVRFRAAEPELYARVDAGRRARGDVVLESGATRWRLRGDASPEEFRALALVLGELARRGWSGWRELDTRFSGRVIVRTGSGA